MDKIQASPRDGVGDISGNTGGPLTREGSVDKIG